MHCVIHMQKRLPGLARILHFFLEESYTLILSVIGWWLTRTTAFEEIKDLLVALIVALHYLWYLLWHMEKLTLYLTIFVIQREPLWGITMDFNNVLLMFITRKKAPLLSCDMFYDLHKPSPSVSEKHSSGEHTDSLFCFDRPGFYSRSYLHFLNADKTNMDQRSSNVATGKVQNNFKNPCLCI